jgi:hypothetical protein
MLERHIQGVFVLISCSPNLSYSYIHFKVDTHDHSPKSFMASRFIGFKSSMSFDLP